MSSASSLGVTAASGSTTWYQSVSTSVFPSQTNATTLGNLTADSTDISVMGQLDTNVSSNYFKFAFSSGSAMKLSFNAITGYDSSTTSNPTGTNSDGSSTLRFQLYDAAGNLVADSGGTDAQQAAYANLTSSSGLSASTGTYYVKVSPASGTNLHNLTSYNFQLYSGTSYTTNQVYSSSLQSYNPALFETASSTVTAANTVTTYSNTASLAGTQASALNIGTLNENESELYANSTLNSANKAAYYSFDFNSGSAIKFNLYNTTTSLKQQTLRVQLYDSSGKVVADNKGTEAQQEAYKKLDSGAGLAAAHGKYTVKISYASGDLTSYAQTYNFQLYSGSTYRNQYKTSATIPTSASSSSGTNDDYGQSVGVFANAKAKLYTRQEYHTIGEKASGAVNAGWIKANNQASDIVSRLTKDDNDQYYAVTLQQGSDLKMTYRNQTGTEATRVRIYDASGQTVIADNYGTAAQKAKFTQLTSSSGLSANQGTYYFRVSYAPNANAKQQQTYDMQIYSGTYYNSLYKFTVSPQTIQNALASGNTAVAGYNAHASTVSLLDSMITSKDTKINLFSALSGSSSS